MINISTNYQENFVIGYNWKTDRIEKTPITHIRRVFRGIIKVNDLKMTDDHPIYLADGGLASYNHKDSKL